MRGLKIVSTGRCVPSRIVTNEDMSRMVDTSDEWITSRTGIKTRHFCGEGESSLTMAADACRRAIGRAGIRPDEIGICIVCTVTPDSVAPTTAALLQKELSLPEDIPCFDINVGCTGFLYGLQVTRAMMMESSRPYGLVLSAESLSRITDFTDRSTCVLFGDGAGAAVVKLEEGVLWASTMGTRGDPDAIFIPGPSLEKPTIRMEGQRVFRFAIEVVPQCAHLLLDQAGLCAEDIDWFVPHQANLRIIESSAKRLGVPAEKFYVNMQRYGNTSAASVPIALDEMAEQGLLQRGQKVMCLGFGAGLTWSGVLLEW